MAGILGRRGRSWEGNIEMNIKETGWEEFDWVYPMSSCEYGNERSRSTKVEVQRINGEIMERKE